VTMEIGDQLGDLGIADLAGDEGRHDAPGAAHRVGELRERELAAGEVRPERAFAVGAVAIAALRGGTVPQRFAGLGVTRRLRQGHAVTESNDKKRDDESVYGGPP